jgi:hypothetical protein
VTGEEGNVCLFVVLQNRLNLRRHISLLSSWAESRLPDTQFKPVDLIVPTLLALDNCLFETLPCDHSIEAKLSMFHYPASYISYFNIIPFQP